ncbi:hypothetical protein GCM10009799_48700 [Nocardiopsis rhodophaea]|uniref:Uncharacterized protein n=1 Tax=Nocardiopsis rhodophaea TaxID=280238 RepID=A0ABP5F5L6_9ACTN
MVEIDEFAAFRGVLGTRVSSVGPAILRPRGPIERVGGSLETFAVGPALH